MVIIWFILLLFWLLMVAVFVIQEIRKKKSEIFFIAIICTSVLLTVFNLINRFNDLKIIKGERCMDLGLVVAVLFGIWVIISVIDIPLTIWSNKLKEHEQSKNSTCIYLLYK